MDPRPALTPELSQAVCEAIAESLARPAVEVQLDSNLMGDLGADSLDFLDIVFKLEQRFAIEVTRGEMERAAKGDLSDEEFAPGGVISEKGLERLKELMPEAAGRIEPGLRPNRILSLFSVRTFANIVAAKQVGQAA